MGTIIKSIAFENFYNYYGSFEDNTYEFTEGINIINADNNLGKSKFYNGFLWILKDEVYDSDEKRLCSVKDSYIKMLSNKARRESNPVEMGVRIIYENGGLLYTITKTVMFDGDTAKPYCEVIKTDSNGDLPIPDLDDQKEAIRRMIPADMERYALLQGESMERLVDLSTLTGLAETVRTLADINNLITMCDKAKIMVKNAKKDKEIEEAKHSSADSALGKLQQQRKEYEDWIEQAIEKIGIAKQEIAEANKVKESIETEFLNSKKRIQLRAEYEKEDGELTKMRKKKEEMELSITSRIFDENRPWLLWALEEEITIFDGLRVDFIGQQREKQITENPDILLPEGSPDVPSLRRMLRREFCEVCGREAKKGTDPYKHIEMVLNRPRKSVLQSDGTLGQFYGDLQMQVGNYRQTIPVIEEEYEKFMAEIDELGELIERQETIVQQKLDELALVDKEDASEDSDRKVLSTYTQAKETIRKKTEEIDIYSSRIDRWKAGLEKTISDIAKKQDNSDVMSADNFYQEMQNLEALFLATKERIYNKLVERLQDESNKMYRDLTARNHTMGGVLQFQKREDGTLKVVVINDAGEELTGNGTGFQRMKQLAIVMSIISSKIGNHQFDYPFISDAPFSEFSINFIENFFNKAPSVFRQSIIMIKDLCDPNNPLLINNFGKSISDKMKNGEIKGTFYVNYTKDKTDNSQIVTLKKRYA